MYKDPNSSSGSGASAKGDEVELVSRFLAPLCARDEAARNIALAAARTTVEGWLGGVGSPNQWEDATEIENPSEEYGKFKGQDGRYDMSVERSPRRSLPKKLPDNRRCENTSNYHHRTHNSLQETFRIESFFPRSVTENPQPFIRELSLEATEKLVVGTVSYDCVDGRFGTETSRSYGGTNETWQSRQSEGVVEKLGRSNSSDEGKGIGILDDRSRRFRDTSFYEARFSSSNESERKFVGYGATREMYDEACNNDEPKAQQRITKINSSTKIGKATRQKQLDDDDLDSDTRIYGKSPKFDESHGGNFGPYESITKSASYTSRNDHYLDRYDRRNLNVRTRRFHEYADETCFEDEPRYNRNRDGVVFNTLEGFDGENMNAVVANLNDDELEDYADYPDEEYTENMNLENPDDLGNNDKIDGSYGIVSRHTDDSTLAKVNNQRTESYEEQQQCLRNARTERKFSAGQIKRPLSQDEDVSAKSGRTLEGPEVTPGDVGRMLNLGNALDGPRQAQANKYLSLVTLHLPVILRLSVNCPFENVRIKCAEILLMVKDRGLPVPEPAFDGPSAFVPTSEGYYRVISKIFDFEDRLVPKLYDSFISGNTFGQLKMKKFGF